VVPQFFVEFERCRRRLESASSRLGGCWRCPCRKKPRFTADLRPLRCGHVERRGGAGGWRLLPGAAGGRAQQGWWTPEAKAVSICCGADEVDVGVRGLGGEDVTLGQRSPRVPADDRSFDALVMSGLPALADRADCGRSRRPMSALDHPHQSRIRALRDSVSTAPRARVVLCLAHAVADHLLAAPNFTSSP